MKNVYLKILASFFIAIIFLSIIVLSGYFIITNYRIFLKNLGLYVQDDCHYRNSKIVCSYINITDKKSFDFRLRNVQADLYLRNLFYEKKAVDLFIKQLNGSITLTKDKKGKGINLLVLDIISTYVDLYVDKGNVTVRGDREIRITGLNFYEKNFTFFIKNPASISLEEKTLILEKLEGQIKKADRIYLDRLELRDNKSYFDLGGFIHFNGDFFVKGKGVLKDFFFKGLSISEADLELNISKTGKDLSGVVDYKISRLMYDDLSVIDIKGDLKVIYADTFRLINTVFSKSLVYKDYGLKKISIRSDININKNGVHSKNKLQSEKLLLKDYEFYRIKSDFLLEKSKQKISLDGGLAVENITGSFYSEISDTKRKIAVQVHHLRLSDILKKIKVKDIDAYLSGTIEIDLLKKSVISSLDIKNAFAYGLEYDTGTFSSYTDLHVPITNLDLILNREDGYVYAAGSINGKNIDLETVFENLKLEKIGIIRKLGIKGAVYGRGSIHGKPENLTVTADGSVKDFFYKNIKIPALETSFLYSHKKKQISIKSNTPDKSISSGVFINFKPFSLDLSLQFKKARLDFTSAYLKSILPVLFKRAYPLKGTGEVKISVKKKNWSVYIDIPDVEALVVDAGDFVNVKVIGEISKNARNINAYIFRERFRFKGREIEDVSGSFSMINKKGMFQVKLTGLDIFDSFNLFMNGTFDVERNLISGDIFSSLTKGEIKSIQNLNFYGNFSNVSGVLFNEVYVGKKKFSENFVNYSYYFSPLPKIDISVNKLRFFINDKAKLEAETIDGVIYLPRENRSLNGNISIGRLKLSKNKVSVTYTQPFKIIIKGDTVFTKGVQFDGMISGVLDILSFEYKKQKLFLSMEGKIDKQLISEAIQLGSAAGFLNFYAKYDGTLGDPLKKLSLMLRSNNLKIKTPYTRDLVEFKEVKLDLYGGKLDIDLYGVTPSTLFGESFLSVKGESFIKYLKNSYKIDINMLPIRYSNIFVGNISSQLKISSEEKEETVIQSIKGSVYLGGRVRIDQSVIESFKKKEQKRILTAKEKVEQKQILKKVLLDLHLSTYSPVYLYGRWGNAYGEGRVNVTGALSSPVVNGEFSIIYGRINYMKNRYNIDYANISIIDNEAYINARLSTSVADTFIFINIYGSVKKPRIDFSSSPPKSRDEILSILLLKDTPAALENIPVFKTIGKIIYALIPFKDTEGKGLFNTGFEVLLNPQYSPTQGITASIYAKRPLTRRIYIALSKPLTETQEFQASGWYELGIKITERTSFQFRSFETGEGEFDINFSLPFDF
ncbi:translocation/assembly module TamB domain-containing protein [Persephonella sp.]